MIILHPSLNASRLITNTLMLVHIVCSASLKTETDISVLFYYNRLLPKPAWPLNGRYTMSLSVLASIRRIVADITPTVSTISLMPSTAMYSWITKDISFLSIPLSLNQVLEVTIPIIVYRLTPTDNFVNFATFRADEVGFALGGVEVCIRGTWGFP